MKFPKLVSVSSCNATVEIKIGVEQDAWAPSARDITQLLTNFHEICKII